MTNGDWSRGLDVNVPSVARMDNYLLGGSLNFEADRKAAGELLAAVPELRRLVIANRAFLANAVRYLLGQGVRGFLDVGSGLASPGGVHEITACHPDARVAYVDADPVVVAHTVAAQRGNPRVTALRGDLRGPAAILSHHNVRALLDLTRPAGVILGSVLQCLDHADAYPAVTGLLGALAPGSYVAVSHPVAEVLAPERAERVLEVYRRSTSPTYVPRTRERILCLLGGLELAGPGLVGVAAWNPGHGPVAAPRPAMGSDDALVLAAVAGKPR